MSKHLSVRRKVSIVAMLICVITIACSGSVSTPLTVQEYAETVCGVEESASDDATWGELRDIIEVEIKKYESVTPPAELKTYHQASLAARKATRDVITDKQADETANFFEFMAEPSLMALMMVVEQAEEDLSAATYKVLEKHGCDIG